MTNVIPLRTPSAIDIACTAVRANEIRMLFVLARDRARFDVERAGKTGSVEALRTALLRLRLIQSGQVYGPGTNLTGARYAVLVEVFKLKIARDACRSVDAAYGIAAE